MAATSVIMLGLILNVATAQQTAARDGQSKANATPQSSAQIDLTGYWVSLIDEEWRWRMMTPPKGDFSFVPLNAEGRRVAGLWDPAADEAAGNQCRAYGAAGIMRLPERLHITWADGNTLRVDIDAGKQTRLLHFDGSKWNGGEPTWQGDSVASWQKQAQSGGFGGPSTTTAAGKGGSLKIVTTHLRPGYLRKNGVPYSAETVLTEYFDRYDVDDKAYLVVTGTVEDPEYLTGRFLTTEQFKSEPDGSKWNPTPCYTAPPTRLPARTGY